MWVQRSTMTSSFSFLLKGRKSFFFFLFFLKINFVDRNGPFSPASIIDFSPYCVIFSSHSAADRWVISPHVPGRDLNRTAAQFG